MSDEKMEKLREKLLDALAREQTYKAAVEWYADPQNWIKADDDGGNRARVALKNA